MDAAGIFPCLSADTKLMAVPSLSGSLAASHPIARAPGVSVSLPKSFRLRQGAGCPASRQDELALCLFCSTQSMTAKLTNKGLTTNKIT